MPPAPGGVAEAHRVAVYAELKQEVGRLFPQHTVASTIEGRLILPRVPFDALWNSPQSTKLEENFFSGGFRREKIKRFGRDRYHVGYTELCGDRGRAGAG
jgi:hypothetical protein